MDSVWNLRKINFVNETVAWALTEDHQIIKTMDGGHIWFVQQELNIYNERINNMSLYAINYTLVYAAGYDSVRDLLKILRTVNGGKIWKKAPNHRPGYIMRCVFSSR